MNYLKIENRLKTLGFFRFTKVKSRGALIDEDALINALKENKIGGAALDVYKEEPLENEKIMGYEGDNLVLTPHIGSQTEETQIKAATGIAEKLSNYLKNLQEESQ